MLLLNNICCSSQSRSHRVKNEKVIYEEFIIAQCFCINDGATLKY